MALSGFEFFIQQICVGSFVSGILIFILTLLMQGGHFFEHDTDFGDHDIAGHDITGDLDHDVDIDGHDVDGTSPLLLLAATFLLTFGGLGILLFEMAMDSLLRMIVVFVTPFGSTYLVSRVWKKVAISDLYETQLETVKVNMEAKTLTDVDENGGLVLVNTGSSIQGSMKLHARTRYGRIPKGSTCYVIEIKGTSVVIEEFPIDKEPVDSNDDSETKVTWE